MTPINATQHQMLRRFGLVSHDLRYFTSSAQDSILSAATVQKHLDSLQDARLIRKLKDGYRITAAGLRALAELGQAAEPTRVTNASIKTAYQPTELMRSNRPGAMDHQRCKSFGTLC